MLNIKDYKKYVQYLRERWYSIYKISVILGISTNSVRKVLNWDKVSDLIKYRIISWYDDWTASRIK